MNNCIDIAMLNAKIVLIHTASLKKPIVLNDVEKYELLEDCIWFKDKKYEMIIPKTQITKIEIKTQN